MHPVHSIIDAYLYGVKEVEQKNHMIRNLTRTITVALTVGMTILCGK